MQSPNVVKTRAAKLHEVLSTMGYPLDQSQCLGVVSDIEKQTNGKAHAPGLSDRQIVAEQYLDQVVEAFIEQDFKKATQYTEEKYLVSFTEREFRKDVLNLRENLGAYVRREFLGSLKGESYPETADTYPDHVRFVWRGFFEKNEGLLIMGLYFKNGTYYTSDVSCK